MHQCLSLFSRSVRLCQSIHRSIYLYIYCNCAWLFVIYQSKCILVYIIFRQTIRIISDRFTIFYLILPSLIYLIICSIYALCIYIYTHRDIDSCRSDMYIFVYSIPPFGVLLHLLSFRVSQSIQGSLLQSNLHVTWEGFIKGSLWREKLGKRQKPIFHLGLKGRGTAKKMWHIERSFAFEVGDCKLTNKARFQSGKSKSRIMTRYENAFRFRAWVCTPTIFLSNSLELVWKEGALKSPLSSSSKVRFHTAKMQSMQ